MKDAEEGKITCVGKRDILTLVLGTPEHPGRVRGKGGKKKAQAILQHTNTFKSS